MTIKQQGGIFGRNPTFNDIEVSGDITVSGSVTVPNDSVSGDAINGGSAGLSSLQIDSTGNSTPLKIFGNTGVADEYVILCLSGSNSDVRAVHLRAVTRGSSAGQGHHLDIMTNPDGANPIRRVRYNYDGDVIFYEPTGVTEKMRWDSSAGNLAFASGQGIDFSATSGTGTSELFNDYEEGEFDVTLSPTTSGTITLVSSFDKGRYTIVGRLLTVTGFVIVDSVSSPVGNVLLSLPIAIGDGTEASGRIGGSVLYYNGASDVVVGYNGVETNPYVQLFTNAASVAPGHAVHFSITYMF